MGGLGPAWMMGSGSGLGWECPWVQVGRSCWESAYLVWLLWTSIDTEREREREMVSRFGISGLHTYPNTPCSYFNLTIRLDVHLTKLELEFD